ncbi:hypothetical protein [Sandaracinus amylolyticus]|uniref:SCP2 domain-containing protein n=1 Tax=Sandaracinus amylolyticus TaxID=927083 RepID=A0A0F6SF18_9BACT|nr:hypothetical protein [Sandaracinus amylolyticus]AKF06169.1 hypothetical protein DB32_003318 [Sandaracinus amylolyticus]
MAAIELAPGADDNGLAIMLATLMAENVASHPARHRILDRLRGRVAIVAEDAEVSLTMEFRGGRVVLHHGIVGIPDLTIRGEAELIGDMSRMESVGPLPDPRGEVNRTMWRALREKRLRILGLPRALPLLLGMGEVLAVS